MRSRLLLLAVLACVPFASGAGDAPLDRATLVGLKSVNIVLDPLAPELQKAGLTQTDLQSRIEQRIGDAHIVIDQAAPEFIGLRLTSVRGSKGPVAVAFNLGIYQPVTLVRDRNLKSATSTWEVETILMADPKVLRQAAMETIDELAARLITAWRSVNP